MAWPFCALVSMSNSDDMALSLVVDPRERSAIAPDSIGEFEEHRLDRTAPARVEGLDHFLGAGGAARDDFLKRGEIAGLVVALAVLLVAGGKAGTGNFQNLAGGFARRAVAQLGGEPLGRHLVARLDDLFVGPVARQRLGGIECGVVVEQAGPGGRQRA